MSASSEGAPVWERQRDADGRLEPNLWYARFDEYRLMGPSRSLLAAYNMVRKGPKRSDSVPNSWRQAAQTWAWRARAEAWDEHERERDRLAYAQEREEWRERRRHLAQSLFLKVVKALDALDPATATLSQITSALAVAMDELRTEYDDQPAQRLQFSGDLQGAMSGETTVKFDLSGLPVEVLRALADEDEPAGAEG